jgi:hypothetical protein
MAKFSYSNNLYKNSLFLWVKKEYDFDNIKGLAV